MYKYSCQSMYGKGGMWKYSFQSLYEEPREIFDMRYI